MKKFYICINARTFNLKVDIKKPNNHTEKKYVWRFQRICNSSLCNVNAALPRWYCDL